MSIFDRFLNNDSMKILALARKLPRTLPSSAMTLNYKEQCQKAEHRYNSSLLGKNNAMTVPL